MAPKKKQPADAAVLQLGDKYKKLDHREHVLSRPGMYIGSIEEDAYTTWVVDTAALATQSNGSHANIRMVRREVRFVPGLYKIFDEILVNAVDHGVRLRLRAEENTSQAVNITKNIRVDIDRTTGMISVTNDGEGIEVEKHPEHNIYIPELIFGHLLTSTNYDDATNTERIVGGQNGIGAKACNVFSKYFRVETVDAARKKLYIQEFRDNMSDIAAPEIKACVKKPYTKISFVPDYARFGGHQKDDSPLSEDMYALMMKRVIDLCAVTPNDVSIHLNGIKLDTKSFEKYVDLYVPEGQERAVFEKVNDRFEVAVSYHNGETFTGAEQVSFVNGIWTFRGGKHVESVVHNVSSKLTELIIKKKKEAGSEVKPMHVKNFLFVFVKSTIPNPTFDSQTKDTLTTPASKFGYKIDLPDKFYEKLYKTGLVEKAISASQSAATKSAKKTDGKKQTSLRGIPKLDDANWAGTAKSRDCTLILTEGDSAKTMAIAGLAEVGRDKYGVFPLKGKIMNVQDVSIKKLSENDEITNLKKILGLEMNKTYDDVGDLRYGKVMIMTDADVDGSHIKGLLFNLFNTLWPSLIRKNGFLTSMLTPIVKAKIKGSGQTRSFYSITDFEQWKQSGEAKTGALEIKYYKGLGTSTAVEAREYFRQLKLVEYQWEQDPSSQDALDLAFNKQRADDRKGWLERYDRHAVLDYSQDKVSYDTFVHRDLIHFSSYDLERSIPSVCDGLKVSQRKVLYGCFKRNLTKQEIRVAQLAAYISEHTAYHHGEASLQGTIIALAQTFIGANNLNLLRPNGQFGTRIQGGKDAASPRYIHTLLTPIASAVFIKDDAEVLEYNKDDDGQDVEPVYYVGTVPLVLINGALGIGTGFSTNIPSYHPLEVTRALRKIIDQGLEPIDELKPWYRGFQGSIEKCQAPGKYVSRGAFKRLSPCQVQVTELPIGTWTEDYKNFLEECLEDKKGNTAALKSYESRYTDSKVDFVLSFQNRAAVDELLIDAPIDANGIRMTKFEHVFKLVSSKHLSTTNMVMFNADHQIQRFENPEQILRAFYDVRIATYHKRKAHLIAKLKSQLEILSAKVRFVQAVVEGSLRILNRPREDIRVDIDAMGDIPKNVHGDVDSYEDYDYLLKMHVSSLTRERKLALEEEEAKKRAELEDVEKTSVQTMWIRDLDAFDACASKALKEL